MTLLRLPKQYHPDFQLPNKKPIGEIEVEAIQGLKLALFPKITGTENLVNKSWGVVKVGSLKTDAATGELSQDLTGATASSSDCGYSLTTEDNAALIAGQFSFIFRVMIQGYYNSGGRNTFFDTRPNFGGVDGYYLYTENTAISNGIQLVVAKSTGDQFAFQVADVVTLGEYQTIGLSVDSVAKTAKLAVDGKLYEFTFTPDVTAPSSAAIPLLRKGFFTSSSLTNFDGECSSVFGFDRALNGAELVSYTRDYKKLLKPAIPQYYFTAGGIIPPGGFEIWFAKGSNSIINNVIN